MSLFREINSLVTSLVKTLLSRNFCQTSLRVNFTFCEESVSQKNSVKSKLMFEFFVKSCLTSINFLKHFTFSNFRCFSQTLFTENAKTENFFYYCFDFLSLFTFLNFETQKLRQNALNVSLVF